LRSKFTKAGNFILYGSLTVGSIAADASAGTIFLTAVAGVIQSRTAAQVLSDIGAAAAVHTHPYQPLDATLTALAALTTTADSLILCTGADSFSIGQLTNAYVSASAAIAWTKMATIGAASSATVYLTHTTGTVQSRTTAQVLSDIGAQPLDATLTALPALTTSANKLILCTGADTFSIGTLTAAYVTDATLTYAKIQNVSATSRVLGRITTGAGSIEELTGDNVKTICDLAFASDVHFNSLTLSGTLIADWAMVQNLGVALSDGLTVIDGGVLAITTDIPSGVTIGTKSIARKVIFTLSSGANHFSCTHGLNTKDFTFAVRNKTGDVYEDCAVRAYDLNTVYVDTTANLPNDYELILTL